PLSRPRSENWSPFVDQSVVWLTGHSLRRDDQPQDGEGTRLDDPAVAAAASGSGHRVTCLTHAASSSGRQSASLGALCPRTIVRSGFCARGSTRGSASQRSRSGCTATGTISKSLNTVNWVAGDLLHDVHGIVLQVRPGEPPLVWALEVRAATPLARLPRWLR